MVQKTKANERVKRNDDGMTLGQPLTMDEVRKIERKTRTLKAEQAQAEIETAERIEAEHRQKIEELHAELTAKPPVADAAKNNG